jgi:hypothetical protein
MTRIAAKMTLAKTLQGKIVREPDSAGLGVVEFPIVKVQDQIDFTKTAGGGPARGSISLSDLREMVENFGLRDRPIPISDALDHPGNVGQAAPGFIVGLELRGDVLYARAELSAELFQTVVEAGPGAATPSFRGFSIEARKNAKTSTRSFKGWALFGGIFTNNPGTDINFRIAAGDACEFEQSGLIQSGHGAPARRKERDMSDEQTAVELAELRATKETQSRQVETLTAENLELKDAKATAERSVRELTDDLAAAKAGKSRVEGEVRDLADRNAELEKQNRKLTGDLKEAQNEGLADRIIATVKRAIASGIKPAFFDGANEKDPEATVAWFRENYTNFERFDATVDAMIEHLPKDQKKTGSGDSPESVRLTVVPKKAQQDADAQLRAMGLDPSLSDVEDETGLREKRAEQD